MTQTEYTRLKATLVEGCIPERRDLIEGMTPRRLAEFIDELTLDYTTPSRMETWRYLAKIAAVHLADYIARVDGPEACTCEMERVASADELATLTETPITPHSLQGVA